MNINGQIFFDMTKNEHPLSGSSTYILKRWTKHSIYFKNGPQVKGTYLNSGSGEYTNTPLNGTYFSQSSTPNQNLYSSQSIYLYDYIIVTDKFFFNLIYTSSIADSTPVDGVSINVIVPPNLWRHQPNTFKNSPNATTNNYIYSYNSTESIIRGRPIYTPPVIFTDNGTYFEIVNGYPRNHLIHKRELFSLYSVSTYEVVNQSVISGSYYKNKQTSNTTVGSNGLTDGSLPVQSTTVGNLNLMQTTNTINQ